jgi:phosphate transport system substrate-binding protein
MKKILLSLVLMGFLGASVYAEKIVVEGSTTVLPISQKCAEVYMQSHGDADISVRGGGSGVGIASLLDGSCDIADSSRAIKDTELDKAVSNGKDIKANIIAMDGIAVVVNSANTVSTLTKQQLKDIYTGKIKNWSELGGNDAKIVVISRDSASGTFEAFGELALDKAKVRPDALMSVSNQQIASTVTRTPDAVGYIGLGYVTPEIKVLTINGVVASVDTVLSGKYLLSRPLFMYTNGTPKGLVKEFIDFVKGSDGQKIVTEEGFVVLK